MVGDKMKRFRLKKGYSLNQLAIETGISKSYLNYIERGIQKNPSIKILAKIAKCLDTTVEELISQQQRADPLDNEWLDLLSEAIQSGVSKKEFFYWLEFTKFTRNKKNEQ